jgi:hypothetical protein
MRSHKRIMLSVVLALAAGLSFGTPAHAGRGSSYGAIMDAIQTKNGDVIASELERAEFLICGACVEPVMNLIDSNDYQIREVAAWWIARRPAQMLEVHDMSIARLYGDDPVLARNAADALGTFRHPNAIQALSYAASRMDFPAETRVAAVRALGTISYPTAEPAIVSAMSDPDASVRLEAVHSYWALRGARDGAPLANLIGDTDVLVRRESCAAIGQYKFAGARVALENALANDPDSLVRRNAAYSLGRIGDLKSRSVLENAAQNDPSSLVKGYARAALKTLQ